MRTMFWKTSHKSYYVKVGGRQVRLGPDKEAAEKRYHELLAADGPVTSRTTAEMLIDDYLVWTRENRAETTYAWYRHHLQSFADFLGPKLKVDELKPFHVTNWLKKSYRGKSSTYRNGACRAASRCFNWARKEGLIQTNPVAGHERPPAEPREVYVTPEQWAAAIALIDPADPFADLLWFLRETGCRPNEAGLVAARHWDRENCRLVLERKNSKGKRTRRVIRLNRRATEIVTRLALRTPEGPIFLNVKGRPWRKNTVICRFTKMERKLGFTWFAYALRHSWCTDSLLRGVNPVVVAELMGHADASMVLKVYRHLSGQDEFLAEQLRIATGELSETA